MATIGLIHLVWAPLGLEPLADFVRAYQAHPAGIDHELVILFKAFASPAALAPYYDLLAGVAYTPLLLPDVGLDLLPYFRAAEQVDRPYLCFLNSYSRIQDDGWLAKLHAQVVRPGVGLVGATASYESLYSTSVRFLVPRKTRTRIRGWIISAWRRQQIRQAQAQFDPFPNYHIRSNTFMLARDLMRTLEFRGERRKADSLRFEAGKGGMTRQILARGLQPLVVGRDGQAYSKEEWYESRTFRSGEQANLLVADNRTEQYRTADPATRRLLAEMAWGPRAAE